jgi:hypothetical protein
MEKYRNDKILKFEEGQDSTKTNIFHFF